MAWTLGEADANAEAIVKEFTDTFYIPKTFNEKALTNRIAGAIRRAEEAARAVGQKEGREEVAEYIAGIADVTRKSLGFREIEKSIRAYFSID